MGPLNGDAAAYAAQVDSGALTERWTHAGYVLAASLASRGASLLGAPLPSPLLLDLGSMFAAAMLVLWASSAAEREGGDGRLAALCVAAVVLPHAPFGEVDLPWAALALLSQAAPAAFALAVAISPTALLALPALCAARLADGARVRALLAAALLSVLLLTILSQGAWWTGDRGVLRAGPLMPGRSLGGLLLHVPWLVVLSSPRASLVTLSSGIPLLLAPPDVPVSIFLSSLVAARASRSSSPLLRPAIVLQIAIAIGQGAMAAHTLREEQAVLRQVARTFSPGRGLVASFRWGARASYLISGHPYGIPWRAPDRFPREPRSSWCDLDLVQVAELPPDGSGRIVWRALSEADRAGCPAER